MSQSRSSYSRCLPLTRWCSLISVLNGAGIPTASVDINSLLQPVATLAPILSEVESILQNGMISISLVHTILIFRLSSNPSYRHVN